jgi:hypothetical protein
LRSLARLADGLFVDLQTGERRTRTELLKHGREVDLAGTARLRREQRGIYTVCLGKIEAPRFRLYSRRSRTRALA